MTRSPALPAALGLLLLLGLPGLARAQPARRSGAPAPDAGAMSARLAEVETRMDVLQADLFATRARLALLMPDGLGMSGAARVRIVHEDRLGAPFRLVRLAYALDGAQVFVRTDPGGLAHGSETEIYAGAIVAGTHVLSVELDYVGDGLGVFTYADGYRFRVRSSHTFEATSGERTEVRVLGLDEGGPLVPIDERPGVRYVDDTRPLGER